MRQILMLISTLVLCSCGFQFDPLNSDPSSPGALTQIQQSKGDVYAAFENRSLARPATRRDLSSSHWRLVGSTDGPAPMTGIKTPVQLQTYKSEFLLSFGEIIVSDGIGCFGSICSEPFDTTTMKISTSCSVNPFKVNFTSIEPNEYALLAYHNLGEVDSCGLEPFQGFFTYALGLNVAPTVWQDYLYIKKSDSQLWIFSRE